VLLDELVEDEVLVETLPELELVVVEVMPPVDVDVEEPPVDVDVDEPPVEVEVDDPPVDVEEPPVDVEVDEPPVDVEEPPVEVEEPPVEVDVPVLELSLSMSMSTLTPPEDEPLEEPDVEPVVVEEITTLPLPPPPPPKKPPKKPPPNPPSGPPPITTGTPPPPLTTGCGGAGGMYGAGSGTIAICGCSQQVRLITLRTRRVSRGASARRTARRGFASLTSLTCFTERYWPCWAGASATWTAPPPTMAQPAAQAESFARAVRTDISSSLSFPLWVTVRTIARSRLVHPETQRLVKGTTPLTAIRLSRCEIYG
jgi:hypothetical protein